MCKYGFSLSLSHLSFPACHVVCLFSDAVGVVVPCHPWPSPPPQHNTTGFTFPLSLIIINFLSSSGSEWPYVCMFVWMCVCVFFFQFLVILLLCVTLCVHVCVDVCVYFLVSLLDNDHSNPQKLTDTSYSYFTGWLAIVKPEWEWNKSCVHRSS